MERAVYGLFDPRTGHLRYIGVSHQVGRRVIEHIRDCRHQTTRKAEWLRSLLAAGLRPEVEVLEVREDWQMAEQHWIASMRYVGCDLTNATDGGDGVTVTQEKLRRRRARAALRRQQRVEAVNG